MPTRTPNPKSPAWAVARELILTALQGLLADTARAQTDGPGHARCLAYHRIESLVTPMPNPDFLLCNLAAEN